MLKSSLSYYSDTYIFVSGTLTFADLAVGGGNNIMQLVFENCAPFIYCISKISNTQICNAKDNYIVISL